MLAGGNGNSSTRFVDDLVREVLDDRAIRPQPEQNEGRGSLFKLFYPFPVAVPLDGHGKRADDLQRAAQIP